MEISRPGAEEEKTWTLPGFLAGTDLFGDRNSGENGESVDQEFPLNPKNAMNPEDAGSLENMATVNGGFSESASAQNLPINTGKYVDISEYRVQDDDLSIDDRESQEETQLQFAFTVPSQSSQTSQI